MTTLTKAVKKQLIISMVTQAAKKKEVSAGIVAENISKELVTLIMAVAQGHVPELPVERWKELVENNVVYPRMGQIIVHMENEEYFANNYYLADGKDLIIFKELLDIMVYAWPKFMSHVCINAIDNGFQIFWQTKFYGVPHIPGTYMIYHDHDDGYTDTLMNNEGVKIHDRAWTAMRMLAKTFTSAQALYEDLESILSDIRTVKQLGERFPEAVKFLPTGFVEEASKAIKKKPSTDLIKSAQKRVQEGIPST